jgi:arsenate reductase (thioredoxin)
VSRPQVLFVCVHNAGRSQMSAALFNRVAKPRHEARSAGTHPGESVHPQVVEAMKEVGIDLSTAQPQKLTSQLQEWADVVVTMGCGDACPYIPGKRYVDWDLEDPAGKDAEGTRRIRDEIERRVTSLLDELAIAA